MRLNHWRRGALAVLLSIGIAGCATNSSRADGYPDSRKGVVESIERLDRGDSNGVAGAIVGGVVGGVIGNQVGSGDGKKIATAAGVVGGAVAGSKIQKHNSDDEYRVTVLMNDGERRSFRQDSIKGLRVGKRVRIRNGEVVPR